MCMPSGSGDRILQRRRDELRVQVFGHFLDPAAANTDNEAVRIVVWLSCLGGDAPPDLDHHEIAFGDEPLRASSILVLDHLVVPMMFQRTSSARASTKGLELPLASSP